MKIKLTQGKFALIDDADYALVGQYKWYGIKWRNTYAATANMKANGRWETIYMHRVIMGLKRGDKLQVDHINHDGLDNRRANLRTCTNQQNLFNRIKSEKTSNRYKGVWRTSVGTWAVKIRFCNNDIYLGCFKIEQDAALAYNIAAVKYYGEFANLNIIVPKEKYK